nr:zf-BED domain-containing protein [Tanacetum cinerariifolium]
MVGGKSFNTENKLSEYELIKQIKQKKRGLGSDRNEAACIEVEELTKAIEEVMEEIKTKTTMDGFVTKDRVDYYSGITELRLMVQLLVRWIGLNFFGKYYPPSRTGRITVTNSIRDPSNYIFEKWLALKFANHMIMDPFTKKVLWDFWIKSNDQGVADMEFFDVKEAKMMNKKRLKSLELKQTCSTMKHHYAQNSRSLNFLLKVDLELFTRDIERIKTYEDYENELNDELEEPWPKDGVPYEIDGLCNGGELPEMVRVGYMTYFQDHEWYNELADRDLKEEALKQKAIYEKSWGDASQSVMNFCAWLKRSFGNFCELDYELLVKLLDYWWKVNDQECSPFSN